jgi:geranylgeranyl pyrophosphate synthase
MKDFKPDKTEVISSFTHGIIEICEGQSLDKDFETRSAVSLNEYKKMIYKKTAALLEMCCSIGARLAGADEKQIKAMSDYGKYLGMAFQITDDLLDITADEKEFGKVVGSDLLEGKKTFLFLAALEKARGSEKDRLLDVMKHKGIKKGEIGYYRELYTKLGVLKDAEREIIKYTKLALKNLHFLPDEEGKNLMKWIANYLINRNK